MQEKMRKKRRKNTYKKIVCNIVQNDKNIV